MARAAWRLPQDRGTEIEALIERMREIVSALEALLEGSAGEVRPRRAGRQELGALVIDFDSRAVWWRGREVHLTPTEWEVLVTLAERPGVVLSYYQIASRIWGPECGGQAGALLRPHVRLLRSKLSQEAILNARTIGYGLRRIPASRDSKAS